MNNLSISKATKADLVAIQYLSATYAHKLCITPSLFNSRDIALQARDENGVLLGFIWMGIMGAGTIGYIDKLMVNPSYPHLKILPSLFNCLLEIALKRKVTQVFGMIRQDQYHNKCAKAAIHMAFGADTVSYTHVYGHVVHISKELKRD